MEKNILGLDLGTNSIGWALVNLEENKIIGMGSRIIPMGAELSKFERGQAQTKNANRRVARGIRRQNKRYKQRRNKLIYFLKIAGMLPDQIRLSADFLDPNKIDRINILPIANGQVQLDSLELIELKVKALNQKVTLKELGRIIYQYNQLRGYSGGNSEPEKEETENEDMEEKKNKKEKIAALVKILSVSEPVEKIFKGKKKEVRRISVEIDNDEIEDSIIEGDTFLDFLKENESNELLISISHSKHGTTYFFKLPNKTSWRNKMENLENELNKKANETGKEVYLSELYLEKLKENKWAKIRNNVVLRSRYQAEFNAIWETQYRLNNEFREIVDNPKILQDVLNFIFPAPPASKEETPQSKFSKKGYYKEIGTQKGLKHVISNQIIYYQRELKDQSHLISNCRFEPNEKVAPKSHPIFQEYRIWEQINKLTINTKIKNGVNKKGEDKYSYVDRPIPNTLKERLFEELQTKKEIGFKTILNILKREYNFQEGTEFLNGLDSKGKIKGNETRILIKRILKDGWELLDLDDVDNLTKLWNILYYGKGNEYDVNSERTGAIVEILKSKKYPIDKLVKDAVTISKIKFARNYSSLSIKAIQNVIPLVRVGKYYDPKLSDLVNEKISKLVNETVTDPFEKAAQEYLEKNIDILNEGGIINAYAVILIYDKHTAKHYEKDELINTYKDIKRLPQGALRNPLAEQIINEALILVKDIWKRYGEKPKEIRIELARELKNNAERRKRISNAQRENETENKEVRERLQEYNIEISIANIEKYKLWSQQANLDETYLKNYNDPSKSELEKMKLWNEQGHLSPYTGKTIPFIDLFNKGKYEVDHIIPKSRYFDDSFANKVICETSVNKDKGNRTAMEYFEAGSLTEKILNKNNFIDTVNKMYFGVKRKNLLATKVPEDPISRQIKDTQYIAIRTKEELNKIVGNNNVKSTTGGVTDYLRNQWGLTDRLKSLLRSRYELILENDAFLNKEYLEYKKKQLEKIKELQITGDTLKVDILTQEQFIENFKRNFIRYNKENKLIIKDYSKRIDHRHHSIDALITACTEASHIYRLNNLNKELQTWLDRNRKDLLPGFEGSPSDLLDEIMSLDNNKREIINKQLEGFRKIPMPWPNFDKDVENEFEKIIVSQKPKDKLIIQKGVNGKYEIKIRGQLHDSTLYGMTMNSECFTIPLSKFAIKNFATEKNINKIVNSELRTEIQNHLNEYGNKEEAFSAEGIFDLNRKLALKKDKNGKPKPHPPISRVKIYYKDPANQKSKQEITEEETTLQRLDRKNAFNDSLFVKTGDNYLFAILEKTQLDKKTKQLKTIRVFDIITFFDAANLLKIAFNNSENKERFNKEMVFQEFFESKQDAKMVCMLKQGDAVYLPDNGEEPILNRTNSDFDIYWADKKARSKNIYVVQKFSGNRIYFIKHNIANPIQKKFEFGSQDCYEKIDNISIKESCIKINIDRLGNIIDIGIH